MGTIPAKDGIGSYIVAVPLLEEMGNNRAAAAASHLLKSFPTVEDVLMAGIAGGIPIWNRPKSIFVSGTCSYRTGCNKKPKDQRPVPLQDLKLSMPA